MYIEKESKNKPAEKHKKIVLKSTVVLLIVLAVLLIFSVPLFVSSQKGKETILAKINDSIDGNADFTKLSMGWLKGLKVTNFSFHDNIGQTFVEIKQIQTKPYYANLLMGNLSFGKTVIDEPKVQINTTQTSKIQPANMRHGKISKTKRKSAGLILPVKKIDLKINNGSITVLAANTKTIQLLDINSQLNLRGLGKQTKFYLAATLADETGKTDIKTEAVVRPSKKKGWSLEGTDGEFSVEVNDLQLDSLETFFELAGLDIETKGKVTANIKSKVANGQIENLNGTVKAENLYIAGDFINNDKFETTSLNAEVNLKTNGDFVNIEQLDIKSDWANIQAKGTVPKTIKSLAEFTKTGSSHSIEADFDIDMAQLLSQMPNTFKIKDQVTVTSGYLTGRVNTISENGKKKIAAETSIKRLAGVSKGKMFELSEPVFAKVKISSDKNKLELDRMDVSSSFATIAITPLGYNADIDLAKLQGELGQFMNIGQSEIAGKVSGTGKVARNQDVINMVGSAQIENLKISHPEKTPFEQKEALLSYEADLNPTKKSINLKKISMESESIKIKKGQFSKTTKNNETTLVGNLECEYDWQAISAVAKPFLPSELMLYGKRKDTFDFFCTYPENQPDKIYSSLNTSGKIGFEKAEYMGLNVGPTEIGIKIKNGFLNVEPFSTTVNKGQLNFSAFADFNKTPTLLETPKPIHIIEDIQINEQMTNRLLMYLNPVFAKALNVTGVADFYCDKLAIPLRKANKNDLEIIGTIAIKKLNLQASDLLGQIISLIGSNANAQNITIHPTKFYLQNGFLRYDNMQMDVGNNPINFKGVAGLDKSLDMRVTLPYTFGGRTVRVDEESQGQRITLALIGTIDNPKLDMGKLLQEQLKKHGEDLFQKAIEELLK